MENKEKIGRAIRFSALPQINGTALILKTRGVRKKYERSILSSRRRKRLARRYRRPIRG